MSTEIQPADLVSQPALAAGFDIVKDERSDDDPAVTVNHPTTHKRDDQRLSKFDRQSHQKVAERPVSPTQKNDNDKTVDSTTQEIPLNERYISSSATDALIPRAGQPTFQPAPEPHLQVDNKEDDAPRVPTALNPLLFLAEIACGSLQHDREPEADAEVGPSNVSDGITFFNRPKNVNDILYLLGQGVHVSYFAEHTVIARNELYCHGKYILSEDGSWVLSEHPCQGEAFSSKDIFDRHVKRKHFGMSTKKGTSYNLEQWAAEWGYTLEGGRDKVNWTYRINWDIAGSYPHVLTDVKEAPAEAKAKVPTGKAKKPPKPKQISGEVRVRKPSLKKADKRKRVD